MITVVRDRQPPVTDATGKWWRWDVSVVTPMGNTVTAGGWTPGRQSLAQEHAKAAEKRLQHLHCRRMEWTTNNGARFTDGRLTDVFTINPAKRPRFQRRAMR